MVKIKLLNELRTDETSGAVALPTVLFSSNTDGTCTCSIAAKVPPNTKAVVLYARRTVDACTGTMTYYPKSGTIGLLVANKGNVILPISNQEIKYAQSTDAEVWRHCCLGYVVEGERKQ